MHESKDTVSGVTTNEAGEPSRCHCHCRFLGCIKLHQDKNTPSDCHHHKKQQTKGLALVKSKWGHFKRKKCWFSSLNVYFCIEVTLEPGTSCPNVHTVWKEDERCKAKVPQMWQKFDLCTGYKIVLHASRGHKRATSVVCRSFQCWHILKTPNRQGSLSPQLKQLW